MALCEKDGTSKSAMEKFKISGLPVEYVNIFRLDFLSNGQAIVDLKIYGTEQSRIDNPDSQIKVVGTNVLLPESVQQTIKNTAFKEIYPYLEAMYILRDVMESEEYRSATPEKKKELSKKVYSEMVIDSPECFN